MLTQIDFLKFHSIETILLCFLKCLFVLALGLHFVFFTALKNKANSYLWIFGVIFIILPSVFLVLIFLQTVRSILHGLASHLKLLCSTALIKTFIFHRPHLETSFLLCLFLVSPENSYVTATHIDVLTINASFSHFKSRPFDSADTAFLTHDDVWSGDAAPSAPGQKKSFKARSKKCEKCGNGRSAHSPRSPQTDSGGGGSTWECT